MGSTTAMIIWSLTGISSRAAECQRGVNYCTWPRVDGWCGSGISLVVCISFLCPEFLEDMDIILGLTLKIVQTSNKPVCRPGDLPMWQHRLVK